MGMVSAHHELGQDTQAIADVQKMPPATYEAALADPGFLSMLGAIYQQANQFEMAQGLLERSAKLQTAAGGQPSVALQLQLAGIYLQRNDTAQAYGIYHQVLAAHPDRVDAWKGLIAALQATNRNSEAIAGDCADSRRRCASKLERDIEFVQTEASLYAAAATIAHAIEYMNRVQAHYAQAADCSRRRRSRFRTRGCCSTRGTTALLYPALMRLGGRADLTVAQRETVQDIWANWSVRRAAAAMENGNVSARGRYSRCRVAGLPGQLDRAQGRGRRICAGGPREGIAGALQDHPHAGRNGGRFSGRHRRGAGGQRQGPG